VSTNYIYIYSYFILGGTIEELAYRIGGHLTPRVAEIPPIPPPPPNPIRLRLSVGGVSIPNTEDPDVVIQRKLIARKTELMKYTVAQLEQKLQDIGLHYCMYSTSVIFTIIFTI
jgi:hypothetical protein